MVDSEKTAKVEATVSHTRGLVDDALKRLHSAVDGVIALAEPEGICPYTEHKCPLWDELARLRKTEARK